MWPRIICCRYAATNPVSVFSAFTLFATCSSVICAAVLALARDETRPRKRPGCCSTSARLISFLSAFRSTPSSRRAVSALMEELWSTRRAFCSKLCSALPTCGG